MAACDSLQHMFEPSLSSWDPQLPLTSPSVPRTSSVTELFGELHFEESPLPLPASPPPSNTDVFDAKGDGKKKKSGFIGPHHRSGGSLQMCTEGLGFESLGDVEDSNGDDGGVPDHREGADGGGGYYCFWGARKRGSGPMLRRWRSTVVTRRERVVGGRGGGGGGSCFPPPISIVNRPWVSLRGYRCDGRFMLKEVTVPAREFLHASREGGRLRLDFVQGVQDDEDDYEEGDEDEEQQQEEGEGEEEGIEDDGNEEEEGDVGNSL